VTQVVVSTDIWEVNTPPAPEVEHENTSTVADKPSQEIEVPEFPSLTIEEEELFRRRHYSPTDVKEV